MDYAILNKETGKWVWRFTGELFGKDSQIKWNSKPERFSEARAIALLVLFPHDDLVLVPYCQQCIEWVSRPDIQPTDYDGDTYENLSSILRPKFDGAGIPYWFAYVDGKFYGPISRVIPAYATTQMPGYRAPSNDTVYYSVFDAAMSMKEVREYVERSNPPKNTY